MARWAPGLLTAAALFWVAAIVAAPTILARGSFPLVLVVYQAGSLVCHQLPDRSFHLAGIQMPVCARCTGLYLSGALGASLAWIGSGMTLRRVPWWLAIVAAPTAVSVALEWMGLVHPSGTWRALLGVPLGAFAGWWFVRTLRHPLPEPRRLEQMRYHA